MNNNYDVKISCGQLFTPALCLLIQAPTWKNDKEFHISGDIGLTDVLGFASTVALSTYKEIIAVSKAKTSIGEDTDAMLYDGANAFIFSSGKLVSAVSISLKEKEPVYEYYSQEMLEQAMQETPTYHKR